MSSRSFMWSSLIGHKVVQALLRCPTSWLWPRTGIARARKRWVARMVRTRSPIQKNKRHGETGGCRDTCRFFLVPRERQGLLADEMRATARGQGIVTRRAEKLLGGSERWRLEPGPPKLQRRRMLPDMFLAGSWSVRMPLRRRVRSQPNWTCCESSSIS